MHSINEPMDQAKLFMLIFKFLKKKGSFIFLVLLGLQIPSMLFHLAVSQPTFYKMVLGDDLVNEIYFDSNKMSVFDQMSLLEKRNRLRTLSLQSDQLSSFIDPNKMVQTMLSGDAQSLDLALSKFSKLMRINIAIYGYLLIGLLMKSLFSTIGMAMIYLLIYRDYYSITEVIHLDLMGLLKIYGIMFLLNFIINFLTGIGLLCLIIPGIYIQLSLILMQPIWVIERLPIIECLKKSFTFMNGYRLSFIMFFLLPGIIYLTVVMMISSAMGARGALFYDGLFSWIETPGEIIVELFSLVFSTLFILFYHCLIGFVYINQREKAGECLNQE